MQIRRKRAAGFTLVEMMVVVAVVGLLSGIAAPSVFKSRATTQLSLISQNLRAIEDSKQQWALESRIATGVVPTEADIAPYLKKASLPLAVVGEVYTINPVGTPASTTLPVQLGTVAAGTTLAAE